MGCASFFLIFIISKLDSGWTIFFIAFAFLVAIFIMVKSLPIGKKKNTNPEISEQNCSNTSNMVSDAQASNNSETSKLTVQNKNYSNETLALYNGNFGEMITNVMLRSFEKAIEIVRSTMDIKELTRSYDLLLDIYDWIGYAEKRGIPIPITVENDFLSDLNKLSNENIIRIANHAYSNYINSIEKIVLQQAVDNHAILLFGILDDCKAVLKPFNIAIFTDMLNNLHFLAEETYSSKSMI